MRPHQAKVVQPRSSPHLARARGARDLPVVIARRGACHPEKAQTLIYGIRRAVDHPEPLRRPVRGTSNALGGEPAPQQFPDRRSPAGHPPFEPEVVDNLQFLGRQHDLQPFAAGQLVAVFRFFGHCGSLAREGTYSFPVVMYTLVPLSSGVECGLNADGAFGP